MSRYSAIKAATDAYIKTNGRQEITGAILNAVMNATIDSLGKFYQFVGSAVPSTDPGTIDQNIAYLASTPGTYTKLGGIDVSEGEFAVIKFDGEWKKEVVIVIPTRVSELINDLGFVTNAVSDLVNYYTKGETYTKGEVAVVLSAYYDKAEVDNLVDALTRNSYIVAWEGTAEPVVGDIPAGVSVTWNGNTYTGTLDPSESTIGNIYLVSNGAGYDEYITSENSWLSIGTTSLDLSGYATASDLDDLDKVVNGVQGINFDVTQSITQGTGVSASSIHSFGEILKAGETYHLKMNGSAASSIALYMKDSSGTNKQCVWNKGEATEATATNKSFTSSVREYTCTPTADIYKYAFYVTAANAVATGDMVLEITKAAEPGIVQDVEALQEDVVELADGIASLEGKTFSTIAESDKRNGRYIKYSDGSSTSTGAYFDTFSFPNKGYEKVLVKVGFSDSIAAAIAFYDIDGYISGIQGGSGTRWYEAVVPSGCTRIVITNRNTTLATPEIYAFNNKVNNDGDTSMGEVFRDFPYICHIAPDSFILDGAGNKLIPGESIGAVEFASRLGFKFIEANVFYTSDDEVVVMHGNSGKFGSTIMSLDGTDPSDTAISSVTLDYIKTYLRYKSVEEKYREICTLEEFVVACKENNIGILLRLGDKAMAELCIRYLGKRMVILSDMGLSSRSYFDGVIAVWNNTATTSPETIINTARGFGRPFIYVAGQTLVNALVSAGQFDDLIQQMHEEGFMMGSAYASEEKQQFLIRHGVDYIASGSFVNPFNDPNYECYDLDGDASQFVTTGTIAGKVATLAPGDTITCGSASEIPVGKGILRIRFNGELSIGFGSQGASRTISSDGSNLLVFSDYFLRRKTQLTITAVSATTITTLVYMTSKC